MRNGDLLVVVLVIALAAGVASADIYSWGGTPTLSDPDDSGIWPGMDIVPGIWFADPGDSYLYFRMDLEMAPSRIIDGNDVYDNFADAYGIYIDYQPGGVNGPDDPWVPDQLTGIDYILDMHFNGDENAFSATEGHGWDAGDGQWETEKYADGGQGGYGVGWEAANGGQSLQWRIHVEEPVSFAYWGATIDGSYPSIEQPEGAFFDQPGNGGSNLTHDITDQGDVEGVIPEPGTMALLGLGLAGMARLRKRRR